MAAAMVRANNMVGRHDHGGPARQPGAAGPAHVLTSSRGMRLPLGRQTGTCPSADDHGAAEGGAGDTGRMVDDTARDRAI
jgi:hypothetical protein